MKVLFTGIGGMDLRGNLESLGRFVRESKQYGRSVRVLKAEKHFVRVLRESEVFFPDFFESLPESQQMIYALGLPKPLLRRAWRGAVTRLLDEEKPTEEDVFLCAHIAFHHQWTREFFSPIDVELLRKWGPDLVVTLVDDTENCLDRLRAKGHMASSTNYAYTGMKGFNNSVNLMRLLFDWRASEMLEAEGLAADLGVKHFCVAVKHPVETVASLVFDRARPVFYMSHPISEPRRDLEKGQTAAFDEFVARLGSTCGRLRRGITLIEPTTIDEFRLRRVMTEVGDKTATVYLPRHTKRWPIPPNPMWEEPQAVELAPLDPGAHFPDDLLDRFVKAKREGASIQDASEFLPVEIAANLLGVLVGHITGQIDARDHKLVEQSDGLIVLRPVYKGNPSQGVEEEIKYHCELSVCGVPRQGGLWIYTHRDDEFAYLIRKWIPDYLVAALREGRATGTGDLTRDRATIDDVSSSFEYTEDRSLLANQMLSALAERGIQLVGRYAGKPLDAKPERASVDARIDFIQALSCAKPGYLEWIERYAHHDRALAWTVRQGPETSLDDFVSEILRFSTDEFLRD